MIIFYKIYSLTMASLLVPLYVYPSKEGLKSWQLLIDAARAGKTNIIAIVNANNGPGDKISTTYSSAIKLLLDAGITVIGYVYTEYGSRNSNSVKSDINRWIQYYPGIHGYFLDEAASKASKVAYYNDIAQFIRLRNTNTKKYQIWLNPGTECAEEYCQCSDGIVIFESPYNSWKRHVADPSFPPKWIKAHPANQYAILVLQVGSVDKNGNIAEPAAVTEKLIKDTVDEIKERFPLPQVPRLYMNPVWPGKSSWPDISTSYFKTLLQVL